MECSLTVKDLLLTHEDLIQACLIKLSSTFYPNNLELEAIAKQMPLDEVALIRFAMAAKHKSKTGDIKPEEEESVMFAHVCDMLLLRQKHAELLNVHYKPEEDFPLHLPGKVGGFLGPNLLIVTELGKTNLNTLAETFKHDKTAAVEYGITCGEYLRQACDRKTRESGRLCRMVNVVDLENISVFNMNQMMLQSIGANSSLSEVLNPLLISQVILVRAPWSVSVIMSMLKPFIPPHVVDTLQYCKHASGDGKSITACPFVSKFIDGPSNVPEIAGGFYEETTKQQLVQQS